MNFKELLLLAQDEDKQAIQKIMKMYKPLLVKEAIEDDVFDEDIYQELCIVLLRCIRSFRVDRVELK